VEVDGLRDDVRFEDGIKQSEDRSVERSSVNVVVDIGCRAGVQPVELAQLGKARRQRLTTFTVASASASRLSALQVQVQAGCQGRHAHR
jgi:hypothetical protein